jgi:hypothetical protein
MQKSDRAQNTNFPYTMDAVMEDLHPEIEWDRSANPQTTSPNRSLATYRVNMRTRYRYRVRGVEYVGRNWWQHMDSWLQLGAFGHDDAMQRALAEFKRFNEPVGNSSSPLSNAGEFGGRSAGEVTFSEPGFSMDGYYNNTNQEKSKEELYPLPHEVGAGVPKPTNGTNLPAQSAYWMRGFRVYVDPNDPQKSFLFPGPHPDDKHLPYLFAAFALVLGPITVAVFRRTR